MAAFLPMKTLVFDTETTGIPKHPNARDSVQPRIIEFGAILVDSSGEPLQEIDILFNPGVELEAIITKITGLTDEDLSDAPRFADCAKEQLAPLFAAADQLVAHNLPFDYTMLAMELERAGIHDWPWPPILTCTVQECAEEWGKRPKLTELYQEMTGEKLAQTHRALDDVEALAEVCRRLEIL